MRKSILLLFSPREVYLGCYNLQKNFFFLAAHEEAVGTDSLGSRGDRPSRTAVNRLYNNVARARAEAVGTEPWGPLRMSRGDSFRAPLFNSIIAPLGYKTPPTAYQRSPFGRHIRRATNRKTARVKFENVARQTGPASRDFSRSDRGTLDKRPGTLDKGSRLPRKLRLSIRSIPRRKFGDKPLRHTHPRASLPRIADVRCLKSEVLSRLACAGTIFHEGCSLALRDLSIT